jgi:hypothetical protein
MASSARSTTSSFDRALIDGDQVALFSHASASGTTAGGFMVWAPQGGLSVFLWRLSTSFATGSLCRSAAYDFTGLLVQVGAIKAPNSRHVRCTPSVSDLTVAGW